MVLPLVSVTDPVNMYYLKLEAGITPPQPAEDPDDDEDADDFEED